MAMSTSELLDVFKSMTVLELNEFLKAFEAEFDVTAAAPVQQRTRATPRGVTRVRQLDGLLVSARVRARHRRARSRFRPIITHQLYAGLSAGVRYQSPSG